MTSKLTTYQTKITVLYHVAIVTKQTLKCLLPWGSGYGKTECFVCNCW